MKRTDSPSDPNDTEPTGRALGHMLLMLFGLLALAGGIATVLGLLVRGH
ncbi:MULTISPECIES: hypothetical protein [Deinococcus]|uniref:Uncharacterized protein n=1 Tax=Deinococcus depolymerans TaxID=392408 RepID=A0ABP3LLK1_9DEIO